eukprot:368219_1
MRQSLWLEVVDFLKTLKLDEYIDAFQSEGFDSLESLNQMEMADLSDMKVKKGHAKLLLHHIGQMKANTLSAGKRVQFKFRDTPSSNQSSDSVNHLIDNTVNGSQMAGTKHPSGKLNLAIVDETKHQSPNTNHPQHLGGHLNNSDLNNSASSVFSNGAITHQTAIRDRPRGNSNNVYDRPRVGSHNLGTPTNPNGVMRTNSSRTKLGLNRFASDRSDGSDEYSHQYSMRGRGKSYDDHHSPNPSLSDAGTVVIRHGAAYSASHSQYTHTPGHTAEAAVLSPSMPPILMDMHHDVNLLIEQLEQAKCHNNIHYDEYHEALVNVTSNWDRERQLKNLKYMNSKGNYSNHVVLDLLGVLHAQLGSTDDAIKYHTDAIRVSNNQYIEAMHNYAYLLHRIGDKENDLLSVKYYKMALSINESFAHCWLHFGNLLEDEGKLKDAVAMYRKAITIRPTNAAFHLDLANVLDDLGDFGEASGEYLKCVELQPNDPVYHWNYAISLENQCFYHKAEEAYKRAIDLDFNCVDAHINYAHMLENRSSPQYRKALNQYEIILKLPEMMHNTEIMLKCAKLHARFGNNEKTEALYMNILQLDPTIEDTYILFAKFLTDQNRIEDANACYQAGIRQIQTPKLQNEYIKFLKDINTIYNTKKNQNGNTRNGAPRSINTSGTGVSSSTRARGASRNVPPSPFVTSMKSPDIDMNDLGYDYYKPAKRESNISTISTSNNSNSNHKINGNTTPNPTVNGKTVPVAANGDDPGCIVM